MQNSTTDVRVSSDCERNATVFVRKHGFQVGAPLQFDDDDDRISAVEYVLGAIGADVVQGLRERARRRRVHIDRVEAVVQGELNNALTYLSVVGEEGHPGFERIRIKVFASTLNPEAEVRDIWDEVLRRSPLVHTFRSAVDLQLILKLVL